MKNKIILLFNRPVYSLFCVMCIAILCYFIVQIVKEIKPKTYEEQYMHCLELGSDSRANACIKLLNK